MECPLTRREKLPEMRPANRYKKSRALANAALENALEQLVGDALCHHGGSDLQETGIYGFVTGLLLIFQAPGMFMKFLA